ncbi:phage tail tape measure protein [Streptomyces longwoodensis]|uniref:phage tail tape measure protein n=1 Tax=Streptomyces longwoodensis TaxID=68231 RepID=UPI003403FF78
MPVEVGVGYVSVVPEARGFGRLLNQQISGESARVGADAGQEAGQGFLGGLGGKLKTGVVGVAAVGGALFAAGFAEAAEQDKATAKLGASLGLSEKDTARAGKLAGSIYAKGYGESIDQVNDSLKSLAQNGVASINAPKRELTGLSKAALNLAETFDADVGEAAKAAGQLIRTGLVKNGKEAFDLLTAGFQSGANKADDLIDTVNEYGTQWRKAGLDGATGIGLINQALQAGARDGDVAADAIKEFSIRAIDGSDTTAQGFKMLGLSADDMAAKFAKGGSSARGVLDLTLDRLRAIKDPVLQAQAATALFGTQAEDLGQALYAMDPTSAAAGLGKIGGAADRMSKTLHGNALNSIEVFKRQALQGLANVATRYALPAVRDFGKGLNTYVLPPARVVGGALISTLVPALTTTGSVLAGGARWVRDYGAWLIPLGIAIGGVAAVAGASAIGTWAMTTAFSVYRGVILAATAVTRGWAIAQGILNAVMNANPVGLIVVGILALVAAVVVAYNKVGWFRSAVQATWKGIQAGWDALWTNALQPGFGYLMTGLRAIGSAATWLWSTVLSPVFSAIATAGKVMFAVLAVIVITPIILYFKTLGAIGTWLWQTALGPAFRGIVALAGWWWSGVKLYFGLVMTVVKAVGAAGTWLYRNAIQPAFQGIVALASWWWAGVKLYFGLVKTGIQAVGAAGTWLYRNAILPAFQGIVSAGSWLWTKGLKPVFDAGKHAVGLFAGAFDTAQKAIGEAFGKVREATRKPVAFVVNTVYTNGIKKVWDGVAGVVGLDPLPAVKFAGGGRTRGGVPGKDSIPALMMADEFVVKRDSARAVGFDTLQYINDHGELPVQRFADGGVVGDVMGWLGGKAKQVGGVVMDGVDFLTSPGKLWDKAVKPIRNKIAQVGQSRFAQMIGKIPLKMLSGLRKKVVDAATGMFGGSSGSVGGSGVKRWSNVVLQALKLVGQPASLLPTVLRRMNQESGGNPRAINNWDINARNGTPSKGLMQVIDPTFAAYAGKLRGRGIWDPLANVYASMRYALSRYGSLASAYNRAGGYANGGRPRPGEVAWVGENGPELLQFGGGQTVLDHPSSLAAVGAAMVESMARTLPQPIPSAADVRSVAPSASGQPVVEAGHTYNFYPRTLDMTVHDLDLLQRQQDARARVGRPR